MLRSRGAAQRPGVATIVLSTYSRAMRHPFSCTFLLVVADECLALQNQSLQTAAAWRLVTRSLYGGHFISGTMFRRHYRDLLDMLQLLRSCLPLQPEFIHAYFEEHLIMYSRESRPWETRLEPMEIPDSVRNQYLEVLDECRGRDAQNYTQVLGRMRQVLNQALRDGRLLAERIWAAVSGLRAEGFKPIIFAATETEAEAIVRHIGCAHRYRHERHPKNCPGCDRCRNFNKFDVGGHSIVVSGSDGPQMDPLVVFTVGADAQGLNLQHLGDAIVLRPTQMDLLVQIMGRLDRPGQASERLCRTIIYLRRSHEEAEVAHLSKYAAFWSLHIRPLARDIVNATMESCNQEEGAVAERLLSLVEGKSSEREASSSVRSGGANTSPREPKIKPRSFLDAECWALQRKDQGGETPVWARRFVGGATGLQAVCRTVKRKVSDQSDVCADTSRPPVRMTEKSLQDGLKFLLDHDAQFRHILQLVGPPTDILELLNKEIPDAFTSLAQTICFQQLSLKVCQQMFDRLLGLCGDRERKLLSPERVLATEARQLREVAKLSFRKVLYIQEAAEQFASGKLSTAWFEQATDHEARQRLNSLNGIGEWSTEMFLIFQLHRHGGYLYGDVAFQKAIRMVYDVQAPPEVTKLCDVSWRPSREQMEERTRLWGPFSSIGCLYCLRVADNEKSAIFLPETSTSIGVPFALPVELDPAKDTVKGKRPKRLKSEKSDESALRVSLAETEGNGPKRPKFSVELKPCASVFSIVLKNTGEVTDLG